MGKKVYLSGGDGVNWALDKNRYQHSNALKDLGVPIVNNIYNGDVIYSIWWGENLFLNWKYKLFKKIFRNKIVIATVTNDLYHRKDYFNKVRDVIDVWVYFNSKQKKFLLENGVNEQSIFWNPSYIDEEIFKRLYLGKKEIAGLLDIDFNRTKNRFLIGSFQRDSLGADLNKPKWQKNPDLLIEILKDLDKDRLLFILAGPRRHYIINKCIEYDIPYVFVGNEDMIKEKVDDIDINNLPSEKINMLYNLVDLYLVTSKSEGEPRAVMETALTRTFILSTDVGIAKDFLDDYCICKDKDEFVKKIIEIFKDKVKLLDIIDKNHNKVKKSNNYAAFKKRIKNMLGEI